MKTTIHTPGMRVRLRRGRFPLDPALVGRSGLIVEIHDERSQRYGVTLDGESEIRDFAEDELEPLPGESPPLGGLGAIGPGVGPTSSGGSGGQH